MKKNSPELNDIYDVCKVNLERYFSEVKKTTVAYLQSVTDLQQEIMRSWRNTLDSAISLQEELAEKSGLNPKISEEAMKLATRLSEEVSRAQQLQSQMLLTSLGAMRSNIKTFNKNMNAFTELRRKVMTSFVPFIPRVDPDTVKKAISEFKKSTHRTQLKETKSA
jgi:hypothetical protein